MPVAGAGTGDQRPEAGELVSWVGWGGVGWGGVVRCMEVWLRRCVLSVACIGLAITIFIRGIYGVFGREITKYMVINGVYILVYIYICGSGQL